MVPYDLIVSVAIELGTVGVARLFVRKFFVEFRHPCMRIDRTVYCIIPRNDFDNVCALAGELQGSILYEE